MRPRVSIVELTETFLLQGKDAALTSIKNSVIRSAARELESRLTSLLYQDHKHPHPKETKPVNRSTAHFSKQKAPIVIDAEIVED